MNSKRTTILFAAILPGLIGLSCVSHVPVLIYWLVGLIYLGLNVWGSIFVSSRFFLPAKCRGTQSRGSIAITFDDGPVRGKTERVLEILKNSDVKAAFFCIGKNVREQPDLAKRIHHEGHILGNHSYLHGTLFDLQTPQKMTNELKDTNRAIYESTGVEPRFFRPPYGVTNPMLARAVRQMKQIAIGWSIRSLDTITREPDKLMRRITRNLKAGDIILLHDRCNVTIEMLPDLLRKIKNTGLKIEPLDKLIGEKPYETN